MRRLQSVHQVVTILGGPTAFARKLGLQRQSAINYVAQGKIPSKFYFVVAAELEALGYRAAMRVFSFVEPAPEIARRSLIVREAA